MMTLPPRFGTFGGAGVGVGGIGVAVASAGGVGVGAGAHAEVATTSKATVIPRASILVALLLTNIGFPPPFSLLVRNHRPTAGAPTLFSSMAE